jgi:hypothetical protein
MKTLIFTLLISSAISQTTFAKVPGCPGPSDATVENDLLVLALNSQEVSFKDVVDVETSNLKKFQMSLSRSIFSNCGRGAWVSSADFKIRYNNGNQVCDQSFKVQKSLDAINTRATKPKVTSSQASCY